MSARTVVYKGMFLAYQVGAYYLDLKTPLCSAVALVHQRFPTNTFPSWRLAHPYAWSPITAKPTRCAATSTGWRRARLRSIANCSATIFPGFGQFPMRASRITACFDNALEFLHQGGYGLAHAMMMLIPEAWSGNKLMSDERRAFYEYHAALMEPWDGPAAVAFTDGRQIGAMLDRNGLQPARYIVTEDDFVIPASEAGVLPVDEKRSSGSGVFSRAPHAADRHGRRPHHLR